MTRLVIAAAVIVSMLSACEKRKGTLLPPKGEAAETEMRARAPLHAIEEGGRADEGLGEEATQKFSAEEADTLEKVKQDALDRIRKPGAAEPDASRGRANAKSLYERGRALVAQGREAEAQEYFLVACQFGQIAGCHKFGWYEQKSGNAANAGQFYRLACDAGLGKSCNNLGVQLEAQKKWEDALNYYARACLERHSVSCENLVRLRNERLKLR